MDTSEEDIVDGRESVSFFIKTEPIEVAIEYDPPTRLELCSEQDATEELGPAEEMESNAAAGSSVEREPCVAPEYSIDIAGGDIKRKSAGAGCLHLKQDGDIDEHIDSVNELPSTSSSSMQTRPNGRCGHKKKQLEPGKTLGSLGSLRMKAAKHSNTSIKSKSVCPHTAENDYLENGKGFTKLTNLPEDSRKSHYTCQECSSSFDDLLSLCIHKKMHTPDKPFSCEECGTVFLALSSLRTHMNVHSEEKLYSCQECGKSFQRSDYLGKHMKTHNGEKPHSCKLCGMSFRYTYYLNLHMKIHSEEKPHVCRECGKSFQRSNYLHSHMRIHSGEKPYICQECGKSFQRPIYLRSHMKIHVDEKSYICKECGKSFRRSGNLRVHMKVHNKGEPFAF